jgi:hypothetical protein
MKIRSTSQAFARPLAIGLVAALCIQPANATLMLKTQPSLVYQYLTTTAVYLGHTVIAGTNLNRLVAGGSFVASCASPDTQTITGERSLTSDLIGQYNQLYVTIPEQLPALRNMPGFENVQRGAQIQCNYNWKSFAREPTYTVGIPGFQITLGGEEGSDSGTVSFWMKRPGVAGGGGDTCIP